MKNTQLSVIFLLCAALIIVGCQQKNYIYIIRHAEKSTEPKADPYLTKDGRQRAVSLKKKLEKKHIQYIFSTRFNRTRETATPLGSETGVSIYPYNNDTLPKFIKKVSGLHKSVLIVGHSNSVITMLDSFHVAHTIKQIPDERYGDLFILTRKKGKIIKVKETSYGRPPVEGTGTKVEMK